MAVLSNIVATWIGDYDASGLGSYNPAYVGSILDVDGLYHTGGSNMPNSIYESGNNVYPFNWYAGQGIGPDSDIGGKYLLYSESGFTWNTLNEDSDDLYEFETYGCLNVLYLGYNPTGDANPSPAQGTLTTFDSSSPLLVVSNFNCLIDKVAQLITGNSSANGNTAIDVDDLVDDNGSSILANPQYYESATLNSTFIYSTAFANTDTSIIEYVLDKYLTSIGSSITDDIGDIQEALEDAGSCVTISYYEEAGDYAANGVVTDDLADLGLCGCCSNSACNDCGLIAA
jgi:hypothetical protein